jgi:hypothetical protein
MKNNDEFRILFKSKQDVMAQKFGGGIKCTMTVMMVK